SSSSKEKTGTRARTERRPAGGSAPARGRRMSYPDQRPRRLRHGDLLRSMVRETELVPSDLIYPLFVCEGKGVRREIPSMPGVHHLSADTLIEEVKAARDEGVAAVILFGIPASKDARGSGAWDANGVVQRALQELREKVP